MTTERFPTLAEIRSSQLDSLRALVAALLPENRFYSERLSRVSLTADIESLEEFSKRLPCTEKQELVDDQAAVPPYGTNLTYPLATYSRFNQTSGTSGAALRWLDTPESWAWMLGNWQEVYRAASVDARDRVFFAFSYGPFLGFWTAYEAATHLGCLAIPGGGQSSLARLETIRDNDVTVLCCTPSYAIRLAEVAREEGLDLGSLNVRRIIVAGEPGGSLPEVRRMIESEWRGAGVFDHHGMTEVGPVTFECPEQAGALHVIETSYLAEVVDSESGEPVDDGVRGELVLTTLGRLGSPLLRYRTGDVVCATRRTPCSCGRHDLLLEGGILARRDEMVSVKGVNVYPTAVESALRAFDEVVEYRVEIREEKGINALRVLVELSPSELTDSAACRIEDALRAAFGLRIPVEVAASGELPRFELKARRWVRV